MNGPADTITYFIAGYAVIFGAMLFYLISLFVRRRNLMQDLRLLQEMEEDADERENAAPVVEATR